MPEDCCPRNVIAQNKLTLVFSVNAAFKLKIEFSIFSRHYTISLIYNFLQAVAKTNDVKWISVLSQDTVWAKRNNTKKLNHCKQKKCLIKMYMPKYKFQ